MGTVTQSRKSRRPRTIFEYNSVHEFRAAPEIPRRERNSLMPDRPATLEKVLSGRSDANIRFNDLRQMLGALGFTERIRGSHHLFSRPGVREMINLQREGSQAKIYQVRQVRKILLEYGLGDKPS